MIEQAKNILEKHNQNEVIEILNKLADDKKEKLANQIIKLNLSEIDILFEELKNGYKEELLSIEPIKYSAKDKLNVIEFDKYNKLGREVICKNKLAVVTMAGGQGTRLGHEGPKGTFMLDFEGKGKKSIFEIVAENFVNAKQEYGIEINWYIMASYENKDITVDFFESNNYFGLNKNNIMFFVQNEIPVIDENGKVLIDENGLIKTASNGNGGIYEVLETQGVLSDMRSKFIEWISVSTVDNILTNPIDPILLGLTISEGNMIASKTTKKIDANEKTGVFCKKNNKIGVIEYSEISDELRNAVDENGELLYGQANIAAHLYSMEALEKLQTTRLRYHKAHKKGAYMNKDLEVIKPEEPNLYKFEKFIFDAFEFFDDMSVLSVNRNEEFAPIKNATGNDSPATALELYNKIKYNKF